MLIQENETLAQLKQHKDEMKGIVGKPEPRDPPPAEEVTPELPNGAQAAAVAVAPEEEETPAAPPAPKIRIGDREFTSTEEALSYAESLEQDKIVAESYQQGIQDAMRTVPQAAAPEAPAPKPEDLAAEFYNDPVGYTERVRRQAVAEAKSEISADLQRERARDRLWNTFFAKNPDLTGDRDLCEFVLKRDWPVLEHMKEEPGMKLLAQKVRGLFQEREERLKPRKELPNSSGGPSSGASSSGVTPRAREQVALDFASQLRSLNKRS